MYARVVWIISAWEGDRSALVRLAPSLAACLLEFVMYSDVGRVLMDKRIPSRRPGSANGYGTVNDGSFRMLVDVGRASVLTWPTPATSSIESNIVQLYEMYCRE